MALEEKYPNVKKHWNTELSSNIPVYLSTSAKNILNIPGILLPGI
jgi:hypothetical protein